jgi:integrase
LIYRCISSFSASCANAGTVAKIDARTVPDNSNPARCLTTKHHKLTNALVMLLTGARRTEVSAMRWAEIDEETRTWVLLSERSKNRQAHVVPLSTTAWEIIAALPRISDTHGFSTSGNGPVVNFCRIKERLDAKLKLEKHWQFHDLRRSCASGLQRLGVRVEVIEAVLGHRSGVFRGITSIYQRHDFADEKRVALQRWADHIEQLVDGKPGKQVKLRG